MAETIAMSLIERAARAIDPNGWARYDYDLRIAVDGPWAGDNDAACYRSMAERAVDKSLSDVRAMLTAIREPSEAQKRQGLVALKMAIGSPDYDYSPHVDDAAEIFRDMVDALLAEQG